MCRESGKLIISTAAYYTVRVRTVLLIHQTKISNREIKRQMMLCINNTPVEDYGCRLNPDSYLSIYMNTLKEDQLRIVDENRRKQDKVKENSKRYNSIKRVSCIIKQGSSYDNIIYNVVNLLSSSKTTEEYTDSILKAILNLSSDTLKDAFIHMGEKISDLHNLKKKWPRWILKGNGVSISSKRGK